ncbi:MAG TPA: DNA polymerase III subunit delta' [Polyangia bacterium]|nr:DNA polymerase III subunit delta' [Polyangia bacterium]
MQGLSAIVGQPRAVETLRAAVAAGKVHHGYLFDGPEGVGKATTARALAMALNCETPGGSGCGRCDSCHKIAGGQHPDFLVFDMTNKGLTERVRDLIGQLGFRPHEGRARVVVFDPAHELAAQQAQAANVLLKTLEEPPPQTHFVLVTAEAKRLPVTVRSRCQRLRFQPLEDATIERWLVGEHGATPGAAREASARAAGSLGRAIAELTDGGDENAASPKRAREQVQALLAAARKNDARAIFDAASELGGDREQAEAACQLLWTVLRDALLVRERLERGRVSPARADFAAQLAGDRTAAALLRSLHATDEAVLSLRGNVAPSLVLEHLMFAMAGPKVEVAR